MPAPELSAFGDGSHAAGTTGLTVEGGGFGAFPGSLWIYQNADRTGNADELTVGDWNDIELTGVDIPGSLNNASGTRYLFLQREDLAWSNALAFTLEGGSVVLTVQDASHGHAADSPSLVQANVLAVQETLHAHSVDNIDLATGILLAVADALHAHAADGVVLTQAHVLAIAEALHGHLADNLTLQQANVLSIADAVHGHSAESPELSFANFLVVADAEHAHTADGIVLTQAHVLAVDSALHAHLADLLSLNSEGFPINSRRVFVVQREQRTYVVT